MALILEYKFRYYWKKNNGSGNTSGKVRYLLGEGNIDGTDYVRTGVHNANVSFEYAGNLTSAELLTKLNTDLAAEIKEYNKGREKREALTCQTNL